MSSKSLVYPVTTLPVLIEYQQLLICRHTFETMSISNDYKYLLYDTALVLAKILNSWLLEILLLCALYDRFNGLSCNPRIIINIARIMIAGFVGYNVVWPCKITGFWLGRRHLYPRSYSFV